MMFSYVVRVWRVTPTERRHVKNGKWVKTHVRPQVCFFSVQTYTQYTNTRRKRANHNILIASKAQIHPHEGVCNVYARKQAAWIESLRIECSARSLSLHGKIDNEHLQWTSFIFFTYVSSEWTMVATLFYCEIRHAPLILFYLKLNYFAI